MEEERMFRIIFVVTFSLFAVVRIYYRSQTIGRESEKEESLRDPQTIFLSIVILSYFAAMFSYILLPDWIFWAHLDLHVVIRWSGVVLAALGIGLLVWIHHTLGRQYAAKLEIQKEHALIEAGPYKKVRHPMYTVFILFSLAVALIAANLLILIFAILIAIPFHWISRKEERMLIDQFGEEYQSYMKRSGRFLPPFRRKD
ncbi:MAG: isoprenylcysteine carboxylmethyltransferase family protein [Candidatus Thorarchaeota archaeon]|nr:isoprenylcysteine carboxylmethyltransferase family protein [Candidatus Thorarchaeota archaeon]